MKPNAIRAYRAAQVRELDRLAIETFDIPGYTLMCRAGEAVFNVLRKQYPGARRVLVLCGAGNNAGDGYVVARLALLTRIRTTVVATVDPARLEGDAELAYQSFCQAGGDTIEWSPDVLANADVIVDAIVGTGLKREMTDSARAMVEAVNSAGRPVISVDIPTGIHADTGSVMGAAINADITVTFIGHKVGLFLGAGPNYAGRIEFASLDVPHEVRDRGAYAACLLDDRLIKSEIKPRPKTAHKGRFGRVLVVGGDAGTVGAVRLAADGALHAGAGAVEVATRPEHCTMVISNRPEIMCHGVEDANALSPLLARADVVAIGPGLGKGKWSQALLRAVLASDKKLVLDADALNLISDVPEKRDNWILTPHAGEAGRMLGRTAADVQADRLSALAGLIDKYGGIAVLKGAGSLVGRSGDLPWICDRGNPAMAAPGMGDVLTGIIAAAVVQTESLFDAARIGVFVHASAGDRAAGGHERGMLASELMPHVRQWMNPTR